MGRPAPAVSQFFRTDIMACHADGVLVASFDIMLSRTLRSIGISALLEPTGLFRADGKKPDGTALIPW